MLKKLQSRIITGLIYLVKFISCFLSYKHRQKLGQLIGSLISFIAVERRNIALNNIRNAIPGLPIRKYNEIIRNSFRNIAVTYLEALALSGFSNEDMTKHIKFENIELIKDCFDKGKGLILLSAHFGNWELMACAAGLFTNIPILIVVKRQKYADKILNLSRTKFNNSVVDKARSARTIVKTLREGGAIALLADQSGDKDKDFYLNFFGRQTATYKSPAELALKFNVPIVIGFSERTENGTYLVRVQELKHDDLEYSDFGVKELTLRYLKLLEEVIISRPDLWAWQHRRWKHSK